MADSLSTTYTGRVVAVNEKGLRLEDHESWCNYSKFAVGVVAPQRGDVVTVVCDSKGFIRAVERLEGSTVTNGASGAPRPAQEPSGGHRDRTITRLAVLKAAAEFAASKAASSSGDVLKIAASWERWVLADPVPSTRCARSGQASPAELAPDELDPFDSHARSGQATAF